MRILAISALLFVCASAGAQQVESLPPLPPLSVPATNQYIPGQVVWADLFTSDVERARQFYEGVFGWEWHPVTYAPQYYGLLYKGSQRVAGIAHRDAPEGHSEYGRWVHFVSTDDVARSGKAILAAGGEELLAPVRHDARGDFAIYAGPHQEVFGLIRSSSGDPGEVRARLGEWIWWQLFTPDVPGTVASLKDLFGYETTEKRVTSDVTIVHLSAKGHARAVVGPLPPDDPDATATWVGFVRVDEIGRTVDKVVANGGKVMLQPDPEILDGNIAVIADPVGTLLGLLRWDYSASRGTMGP